MLTGQLQQTHMSTTPVQSWALPFFHLICKMICKMIYKIIVCYSLNCHRGCRASISQSTCQTSWIATGFWLIMHVNGTLIFPPPSNIDSHILLPFCNCAYKIAKEWYPKIGKDFKVRSFYPITQSKICRFRSSRRACLNVLSQLLLWQITLMLRKHTKGVGVGYGMAVAGGCLFDIANYYEIIIIAKWHTDHRRNTLVTRNE